MTDVFANLATEEEDEDQMPSVAKANILSKLKDCKQILLLCKDRRFKHICHAPDQNQLAYDGHVFKKFAEYNDWLWIPKNMSDFEEICDYYSSLFWGDLDSSTTLPPQEVDKRWQHVRTIENSVREAYEADDMDIEQLSDDEKNEMIDWILRETDIQNIWDELSSVYLSEYNNDTVGLVRTIQTMNNNRFDDEPLINIHDITNGEDFSGCICAVRRKYIEKINRTYCRFQFLGRTECLYPFFQPHPNMRKNFITNISRIILKFIDGLFAGRNQRSRSLINRAQVFYGTTDQDILKNINDNILEAEHNHDRTYRLAFEINEAIDQGTYENEKFANPLPILYEEAMLGNVNFEERHFDPNVG